MTPLRVLGVDLGSGSVTGLCVLEDARPNPKVLYVGEMKKPPAHVLQEQVRKLLYQFGPGILTCHETVGVWGRVRTAMRQRGAADLVAAVCGELGLPAPRTFAPQTIKAQFAGNGHAKKEQMIRGVKARFGMEVGEHAADSIAAAFVCIEHEHRERIRRQAQEAQMKLLRTKKLHGARR